MRDEKPKLFLLKAENREKIYEIQNKLVELLKNRSALNLNNLEYTLQMVSIDDQYRVAIIATSIEELSDKLNKIDDLAIKHHTNKKVEICFMFPGQGSSYKKMGKSLYENQPLFKFYFDKSADHILKEHAIDLRDLFTDFDDYEIFFNRVFQLYLFSFAYALTKFYTDIGIIPNIMIGHSLGEYVAACISGVWSLEDTLNIIFKRQKIMAKMPVGAMLSVISPQNQITKLLTPGLTISLINSPTKCVISGKKEELTACRAHLIKKKIPNRFLNVNHAYHSADIDLIADEFVDFLKKYPCNPPEIPFISNLTGKRIREEDIIDHNYWRKQMRHTVLFAEGIASILREYRPIFIEMGPRCGLATFVKNQQPDTKVIMPIAQNSDEYYSSLEVIGKLWEENIDINWEILNKNNNAKIIPLLI